MVRRIIIGVVVFFVLLIIIGILAGDSETPPATNPKDSVVPAATAIQAVSPMPTSTPAPTAAPMPTSTPAATPTPTPTPEPLRISGSGDSVITCMLSAGTKVFNVTHSGQSNFAVILHDDKGGRELLVNDIGSYSGSVLARMGSGLLELAPGPCHIEVKADGAWVIEITG